MRGKILIAVLCAATAAAALTVSPSRADSIPSPSPQIWPCLGLSGAAYLGCVQQQIRHPTVAFGSPFGNPGPLPRGYMPYHPFGVGQAVACAGLQGAAYDACIAASLR
jgi:hypothetical protein